MFGLREARHQFEQNPLGDRGVSAEDQRLESCTDFGMTGGTRGMDPTDVSMRYMRGPFASLLSKLFGGQVEGNRPERIRELL